MKIECNITDIPAFDNFGCFEGNSDIIDFMKAYIKLQIKGTTDIRILFKNLLSITSLFDSTPENIQNFFNMSEEEKIKAQRNFLFLLQKWDLMP